ncbi:MAG: hypothetical protein NTY05_04860 [Rhodocyclales bacterium]|nr:hypothetical protein [Rhodocyclales bacterium]
MRAMILEQPGAPLRLVELQVPRPRDGDIQGAAVLTMDGQQPYTQPVGFGIPA